MSEIIIMIMFYLHLLMPGQNYTYDQVEDIYMSNQHAVTTIQNDEVELNNAVNFYNNTDTQLHGEWDIEVEPLEGPPPFEN